MRAGPDVRLYSLLLAMARDLKPYHREAVETYRDLRREAAGSEGAWGVTKVFLHSTGHALAAILDGFRQSLGNKRLIDPAPRHPARTPTKRSSEMLNTLVQDLHFALRGLRQRPAFSLAVIVMIGLGVGATTTVFSVVDGVLLRGLPYPEAERLVYFDEGSHPGPLFEHWQDLDTVDAVAAAWDKHKDLLDEGPPAKLAAVSVTPNFLPLFGATTLHGRLIGETDAGTDRVVVLDAGLWRRRWGGDPSIVGREISLDGEPWTVIGVLAPSFVPPEALVGQRVDLWLPLDTGHDWMQPWNMHILSVVGRLSPGVGLAAAQTELDELGGRLAEQHRERLRRDGTPRETPLVPLHEATVGQASRPLLILLGAVGLMLLIACANVANLLLARGTDRRRELALRSALGAGRVRLAGQLLVESVTLALAGGLLGAFLAQAGVQVFELVKPHNLPRAAEIGVDLRVLGFALAVSLVTGVLFGLAPALQSLRTDVNRELKETRGAGGSPKRLRAVLVIAEVALALMLLTGAGLLGHSLLNILRTDPGLEVEGLARIKLVLGSDFGDESRLPFARELLPRLESLPGVTGVAAGWTVPFDETGGSRCCWRSTFRDKPEADPIRSLVHPITPGYFFTLRTPPVRGRELTWRDGDSSPKPVVLNRTMARRLFGDAEPIGQRMFMGNENPTEMRVVGLVEDVRRWGLNSPSEEAVYVPYSAYGHDLGELSIVVRTATALTPAMSQRLREQVWEVDPALPIADVATMPDMITQSLSEPRFFSLLFGVFAALAVILAAAGIASSLLYSVGQRHHELGIRMAVGARGSDLLGLVIRQGMTLTAVGLLLGLTGAGFLSHLLGSLVHGLSTTDPSTFAVVSAMLATIALAACLLPALKASRTDPVETLRAD